MRTGSRAPEQEICGALDLKPGDTRAAAEAEILDSEFLPRSEWASIAEALIELPRQSESSAASNSRRPRRSAIRMRSTLIFRFSSPMKERRAL